MATTRTIRVRIDEDLSQNAIAVLEPLGLTMSDALRILLQRVAATGAFPLELDTPNAETRAALDEAAAILAARKARFTDPDALLADLGRT